eukprot:4639293-Amphidinium_carterae.1
MRASEWIALASSDADVGEEVVASDNDTYAGPALAHVSPDTTLGGIASCVSAGQAVVEHDDSVFAGEVPHPDWTCVVGGGYAPARRHRGRPKKSPANSGALLSIPEPMMMTQDAVAVPVNQAESTDWDPLRCWTPFSVFSCMAQAMSNKVPSLQSHLRRSMQ